MAKKPRIKVPSSAKKGEVIQVKTLVSHKMETGLRKDKKTGKKVPRDIINRFECIYNGTKVFGMGLQPSISANPYISFFVKAEESGELEFVWTDDSGKKMVATRKLSVS